MFHPHVFHLHGESPWGRPLSCSNLMISELEHPQASPAHPSHCFHTRPRQPREPHAMKKFPPALERLLRWVGSTLSFSPRGPSSSPRALQRTTSSTMQHRRTHTPHLWQEEGQESDEQCPASHQLPSQASWQSRGMGGCKAQSWLPCARSPTAKQDPSSSSWRLRA